MFINSSIANNWNLRQSVQPCGDEESYVCYADRVFDVAMRGLVPLLLALYLVSSDGRVEPETGSNVQTQGFTLSVQYSCEVSICIPGSLLALCASLEHAQWQFEQTRSCSAFSYHKCISDFSIQDCKHLLFHFLLMCVRYPVRCRHQAVFGVS